LFIFPLCHDYILILLIAESRDLSTKNNSYHSRLQRSASYLCRECIRCGSLYWD